MNQIIYFWRLRRTFKKFLSDAIPYDYITLEKLLGSRDFLSVSQQLLRLLVSDNRMINTKKFLSIYMITTEPGTINFFPDTSEQTSLERNLYNISMRLKGYLHTIFNEENRFYKKFLIYRFNESLLEYYKLFDEWREIDRLAIIESLIHTIFELEAYEDTLIGTEQYDDTTIEHINIEKEKTLERLRDMKGLELLEKYRNAEKDLEMRIRENVYKAYWHSLSADLSKSPPDYLALIPLLEEVIRFIGKCTVNNDRLLKEVIETLDLDYLKQKIIDGVMSHTDILHIVNYIVDTLKQLQGKDRDKDLEAWKVQLNIDFYEKLLPKFFVDFFKETFHRFEEIIQLSDAFRATPTFDALKDIV
jgi:hypothetical protein